MRKVRRRGREEQATCTCGTETGKQAEYFFYAVGMGYRQEAEYSARLPIGAKFHPKPEDVAQDNPGYW